MHGRQVDGLARAAARRVPARAPSASGLQRQLGNHALTALVARSRSAAVQRDRTVSPTKKSADTDYDNTQYRVSGSPEDRLIELVERRAPSEDRPTPHYVALGKVTGFSKAKPILSMYDQERDLGDWAPKVTHVNGMQVSPKSGMTSAEALLDSVTATIRDAGDDAAVDQSAVDVLFTYSAKRSNIAVDLFNCIKGKARVEDGVTRTQEQLMLDAVAAKRRIHVSAHSRGTIKTDNAVRTVFKTLTAQYEPALRTDRKVRADARRLAVELEGTGLLDARTARELAVVKLAAAAAEDKAREDMDRYIQLVYGGNAVSYPSSALPVELFVGSSDFVSLGVGTYTDWGAKLASGNARSKLHKQGGGHGYTGNYAKPVGQAIGDDLLGHRRL